MISINCSFKYNPGHFSHLIASYKLFESLGEETCLFVNEQFNEMDTENKYNKYHKFSDFRNKKIGKAVIWFPSLQNILLVIYLHIFHKSKIFYVFHEPFDSITNYRKGGFSYFRILKFYLIDLINIIVVRFSHVIILPSNKSYEIYSKRYKNFNSNYHLMPLLFDDEADSEELETAEKKYISYIGTIAEDHAFNKYINFLISVMDDVDFENFKFLIATKSNIDKHNYSKIEKYIKNGKVKLIEGKPLSNKEINTCYLKSIVVWNAYDRSNQSGVLPKAFMFGTPVIVTINNTSEFLVNNKNGMIITDNTNQDEIKSAILNITENINSFKKYSRESFFKFFYYLNHIEIFK